MASPARSVICVASADTRLRDNAVAALAGQGMAVVAAESVEELARLAAAVIAVAVVDPMLPGLGDNPLARLRADPALHACGLLLMSEEERLALLEGVPAAPVVAMLLRVHAQVTGDAQLELLQDVSDEITGSHGLEATMDAILHAVAERTEIDTATLFMLADGGHVEARAAWGYELAAAQLRRIPAGEGVVGWVIAHRAATIVGDSDLDARFAAPGARSSRSMLAVPVLLGHRVLGALTLVRRAPRPQFSDGDLVVVATIGNSAGIALENARLVDRERELSERLAEADRLVGEERRLLAEIQEYDRLYTQVVATVSHELKTPLMGIRGFAGMLRDADGLGAAEVRDFANEIHENAVRLGGYIEGILTEDAVHSERIVLELEDVDLRALVTTVLRTVAPTATPRHQLVEVLPELLPTVLGDPGRLLQVLTNLLSNAVKYSPEGGRVEVGGRALEGDVELFVEDQGLGIPEELRARVFERFYRVASPSTRSIGGTGLGLSIVKGLVELHGGRIRVEPGGGGIGSRFTISLPRSAAASPPAAPAAAAAVPDPLPLSRRSRSRAALARLTVADDAPRPSTAEVS